MNNKMPITTYLSIITLNVNGLNAPLKRHRVTEWIRKHELHICCVQETSLRSKDTQTESKWITKGSIQMETKKR